MRTTCLSVLMAPLLTGIGLAQQAAATPEVAVAAFHAALASGDSAAAMAWLAEDVVIFEGGSVERSRDEYRSQHLRADMAFAAATRREVLAQRSGAAGDVAWVLSETRATGTFRERPVDSRGTETMVLRRGEQGWRIVHIHWSSRRVTA